MKILIIDDDVSLSLCLKNILEKNGFVVDSVYDGTAGLSCATSNVYDVIVLDVNLPNMDGISICASIRKFGISAPILFLTVKDEINAKIRSFVNGCDDYVLKPFSSKELILRLQALARRPKVIIDNIVQFSDLKLNLSTKEVYRGNSFISLTKKEFILLSYLMRNIGKIVSRDDIFDNVWDMNANASSNIVEVYINRLRKKIDILGFENVINNILGIGYYIGKRRYF